MYDFAIVGSGVSGGRIAFELTAAGAKCLLVEAGRAFDRHSYPPGEMGYSTQMFWNGGLEISRDARLGFLRGKCLGGTSVVNQADLNRFDDRAWDDWRSRSGIGFFQRSAMDPLYDDLKRQVTASEIPPEHYNRNARLFVEAFERRGYHWSPILRSQSDCRLDRGTDCIVCLGGCPRDAKQSTLVALLPQARAAGLEIETELAIDHIDDASDHVRLAGRQRGTERTLHARRVVLAGGALGNCEILLRSREIAAGLPALGTAFCCHPQFMTYGVHREPVDAHRGALQSVESHDERFREAGIKLENVFAPPIATAMLLPGVGTAHHQQMRKYRHIACVEVAIRDEPVGRVRLDRRGKLVVDKPLTAHDRQKIRQGLEIAYGLHAAAAAVETIRCEQGFGLHLMGGCPIGTDPRTSVVGPDFHVHGRPNLLVADSSVFPAAPGINPSFTIMALGLRASRQWLTH
ncbi:MAG: GMC family oxidoreductase N-terminal domain-containing protein [Pirellulales bacterium]